MAKLARQRDRFGRAAEVVPATSRCCPSPLSCRYGMPRADAQRVNSSRRMPSTIWTVPHSAPCRSYNRGSWFAVRCVARRRRGGGRDRAHVAAVIRWRHAIRQPRDPRSAVPDGPMRRQTETATGRPRYWKALSVQALADGAGVKRARDRRGRHASQNRVFGGRQGGHRTPTLSAPHTIPASAPNRGD